MKHNERNIGTVKGRRNTEGERGSKRQEGRQRHDWGNRHRGQDRLPQKTQGWDSDSKTWNTNTLRNIKLNSRLNCINVLNLVMIQRKIQIQNKLKMLGRWHSPLTLCEPSPKYLVLTVSLKTYMCTENHQSLSSKNILFGETFNFSAFH